MTGQQLSALADTPDRLAINEQRERITPDSWLTQADIREFQILVERHARLRMDDATAWRRAIQLVGLVRSLLGPIPEDREDNCEPGSSTPVTIAP